MIFERSGARVISAPFHQRRKNNNKLVGKKNNFYFLIFNLFTFQIWISDSDPPDIN